MRRGTHDQLFMREQAIASMTIEDEMEKTPIEAMKERVRAESQVIAETTEVDAQLPQTAQTKA